MTASTKTFEVGTSTYVDVSEGAAYCAFGLQYNRNVVSAVRIHLGQSLPLANTDHYIRLNANINQVGANDEPRDTFVEFKNLNPTDRVYVMGDGVEVTVRVVRI